MNPHAEEEFNAKTKRPRAEVATPLSLSLNHSSPMLQGQWGLTARPNAPAISAAGRPSAEIALALSLSYRQ